MSMNDYGAGERGYTCYLIEKISDNEVILIYNGFKQGILYILGILACPILFFLAFGGVNDTFSFWWSVPLIYSIPMVLFFIFIFIILIKTIKEITIIDKLIFNKKKITMEHLFCFHWKRIYKDIKFSQSKLYEFHDWTNMDKKEMEIIGYGLITKLRSKNKSIKDIWIFAEIAKTREEADKKLEKMLPNLPPIKKQWIPLSLDLFIPTED